ncbi:hypothetical protein RJ639_045037 [Escallonia herrerae]|uniref:Uncharacterized protein n=1 Tax=Escallonia herrerae TaxID=1293975 RepID=A0AA89B3Y3_9ASTE|nr:hypothetical protein RJ639_045037 [Escallonia herrerae]
MATSETIPKSGPVHPNVQHSGGTNYILNGLDNALYNVYGPMVNVKALWESLDRKYKMEDAGSRKFVVEKFLDFKMVDSKTVISQVQEFQLILHGIHAEGMHKRKEMKLEDLIVRLRIEEDNCQSEKKANNYHQEAKANVVEQAAVNGERVIGGQKQHRIRHLPHGQLNPFQASNLLVDPPPAPQPTYKAATSPPPTATRSSPGCRSPQAACSPTSRAPPPRAST